MDNSAFTTNVGDYLVIQITGDMGTYIAEVTQSKPLQMKVQETGPYAHLKDGDFIINDQDSAQIQKDRRESTSAFLASQQQAGHPAISGLKSLGINEDRLREILPG